jgi:hypothetical protein
MDHRIRKAIEITNISLDRLSAFRCICIFQESIDMIKFRQAVPIINRPTIKKAALIVLASGFIACAAPRLYAETSELQTPMLMYDGAEENSQSKAKIPTSEEAKRETNKPSATVDQLIAALKNPDKEVREAALTTTLKNPNEHNNLAYALGQINDPKVIDILIATLKDPDTNARSGAVLSLGGIHAPEMLGASVDMLTTPGFTQHPKVVDALIATLKDADKNVRARAAEVLGFAEDAKVVDPLIITLKDADSDVRKEAVRALGQIKDPKALDPLIAALKDPDKDVRAIANFW